MYDFRYGLYTLSKELPVNLTSHPPLKKKKKHNQVCQGLIYLTIISFIHFFSGPGWLNELGIWIT